MDNEQYRVFCAKHDPHRARYTLDRPVLDDQCPWCVIEGLKTHAEHHLGCSTLNPDKCSCGLVKLLARITVPSASPELEAPLSVVCARCGKPGTSDEFMMEEGDEWECPPCWERCEAQERAALGKGGEHDR